MESCSCLKMLSTQHVKLWICLLAAFSYQVFCEDHSKWIEPESEDFEVVYPRISRPHRSKRFARMDEFVENKTTTIEGPEPVVIVIRGDNKTFFLELHPVDDIVSSNFTFSGQEKSSQDEDRNECLYRGHVISHLPGIASFWMCSGDDIMYGSWIIDDGRYVLRPDMSSNEAEPTKHKLYKLKTPSASTESFCANPLTHPNIDESSNLVGDGSERRRRAIFASKVIETAVFADSALMNKFQRKYKTNGFSKLTSYVMAVVNEVQLIYDFDSMETKFKLVLIRLEVLKPPTAARYSGKTTIKKNQKGKATQTKGAKGTVQNAPNTGGGDIDKYLDNFCNWQAKKDPQEGKNGHWDHAIMLTGLNLYKSVGKRKNDKVLGQAWLDGMCIPKYSCTINEGDDFEAAYVIAHEMGHNLGMPHDGDGNSCDGNKFIMSPVTGAGKMTWSKCSNKALVKFLKKDQVRTCLSDDARQPPKLDFVKNGKLPGQEYPPDQQCKLSMGKNYVAYIPNKKPYSNICRELWCITGMTATTTHPALDGSACENGKMCRQGKCSF